MSRKFEVIVWGSTGFTGKLVCSYLAKNFPSLRWAIAGRSESKLNEVISKLGLSVPVLIADLADPDSLDKICKETIVLLTTAGPYAQIGTPIVDSCVRSSTHYCDLTGESQWVRTVIDRYHEDAKKNNVKIVNCCGFDCIPCDLGTQMIIEEMEKQGLQPKEVRLTVGGVAGGASGGTIASVFNLFESSPMSVLRMVMNPYCLCPRDASTGDVLGSNNSKVFAKNRDSFGFSYDKIEGKWVMPYFMQAIDTRVVNRSNAIGGGKSGWRYGRDFIYSERMAAPNVWISMLVSFSMALMSLLMIPFVRSFAKMFLPKQGEGPSVEQMENGFFKMRFWGKGTRESDGQEVLLRGSCEGLMGDPGYKETSKMISEAAVCLAKGGALIGGEFIPLPESSGVLTPATALGPALRKRLTVQGIKFSILD